MGRGTWGLLPRVPTETRGEGRLRKGREWKEGAVSEGRRLNLGRSSRQTIGLASCTQLSLLNCISALAPGVSCPETDLLGGILTYPQPLFGGAKQSFLAGKSPTSLLGCRIWGLS